MLGKMYVRMLSSGCILFSSFQITFRCEAESDVCIFIRFGGKDDKQVIRGFRDENNFDDSQILRTVAKWLQTCHRQWNDFIEIERDKNDVLNYFTMAQLVIFQKELVKVGTYDEPSVLVYPILAIMNPNVSRENLLQASNQAKEDLKRSEIEKKNNSKEPGTIHSKNIADEENLQQQLIDLDFDERLVLEALKKFQLNEIEEGL